MRFFINVIDDHSNSGTNEEMLAIDAFNDQMAKDGYLLMACGLYGPEESLLIDNRSGANLKEERSLFLSKEHYSGFWLVKVPDRETAVKLAFEGSKACNRKVELRQLHGE